MGEYEPARPLEEDTLARQRRVLGEDHPDTLRTAHNLGIQLAKHDQARKHDQDAPSSQGVGLSGVPPPSSGITPGSSPWGLFYHNTPEYGAQSRHPDDQARKRDQDAPAGTTTPLSGTTPVAPRTSITAPRSGIRGGIGHGL